MAYHKLPAMEKRLSLDTEQSDSTANEDHHLLGLNEEPRKTSSVRGLVHWAFHGVSVVVILLLTFALERSSQLTRQKCWDMYNAYSPVNEGVVPHPYVERQFNGSLWHQTPWTGPPNDDVVKAWHEIMEFGLIRVEEEDIAKVKQPDWSAQFPDELGGGYIAATIGSHQVHCLYYIWQDHYMSYFPEVQDKQARVPLMYERHYEHCVDYIRQTLMCQFDTGIMPYAWVLDHAKPTPNGNTWHKCVDWDSLQDHLASKAVVKPDDWEWYQPEGVHRMDWNP